jgi:hypothetical protein
MCLGEVRRPEDIIHRRGKPSPDLTPMSIPQPIISSSLEDVIRDIKSLIVEIAKIKRALRAHGIAII